MEEWESASSQLDSKLISCLRLDLGPFIERLGEPQLEDRGFSFPPGNHPFHRFTVGYTLHKKFLGKIYLMTLEGKWAGRALVPSAGSLELRYAGFIRKKRPFFTRRGCSEWNGTENTIISRLHHDQTLLEDCWKLEIEFLKIIFDPREGSCRIQARPYGGSLLKIMLPPLHYHVRLVPEQAVLILAVMNRIAEIFNKLNK